MADTETVTRQLTSAINNSTGGTCTVAPTGTAIYDAMDCSFSKTAEIRQEMGAKGFELLFKDIPDNFLAKLKRFFDCALYLITIAICLCIFDVFNILMYAIIFVEAVIVKITLVIIFALAPLFISALLFEPTKKYFEGWLSKLVYCVILQVIIVLFMDISIGIMSGFAAEHLSKILNSTDFIDYAIDIGSVFSSFIVLQTAFTFIFFRLPHIAGDLTGHSSGSSGIAGFLAATGARSGLAKGLQAIRNLSQKKPGGTMEG